MNATHPLCTTSTPRWWREYLTFNPSRIDSKHTSLKGWSAEQICGECVVSRADLRTQVQVFFVVIYMGFYI
jgi:hypothetical protein